MLKHRFVIAVFAVSTLVFLLGYFLFDTSLWGLWGVLLLLFGLTIWGAFDVRQSYFLPILCRNKEEKKKRVALTFDDGPTIYTPEILNLLDRYNAKATFFCIGREIEKHPEILKEIYFQKHLIGNHTYTHANNTGFLSTSKMVEEIETNDQLIKSIIGVYPKLYRPPFGVTNPHIAKAIKKTRHSVIGWNIRSLDTVIQDENRILKKAIAKIKPGSVVLLHDTSLKTVHVVERLLQFLKENDYECVTIEDLFGLRAYSSIGRE